jgi:hypothetical protein
MLSGTLRKDHAALVELYKAMKPEERLIAFFNHSRLIHKVYQAGRSLRRRPTISSARKNTPPLK